MSAGFDGAALLAALAERRVEYVIVGGFAVIAHGVIRTTRDLDICPNPSPENIERLAALLRDADAVQVGVGELRPEEMPLDPRKPDDLGQGGNFRLTTRYGALDIMQWLAGIEADQAYATLAEDAVSGEVAGLPVRVASLDALRRMKRAAGRPQDLDDLRQLELAHGLAAAVDPARVTVAVLNGTTVPGLAATMGDRVETEGFQLGTVTNNSDQELAESVVLYAPGAESAAAEVGRRLGISQREAIDAESQALAGDATVVVVAGADQAEQ